MLHRNCSSPLPRRTLLAVALPIALLALPVHAEPPLTPLPPAPAVQPQPHIPAVAPPAAPATAAPAPVTAPAAAAESLPLKELRTFADVFGRIKSDYVEPVTDRDLLASAIRGMLSGLDPHSAYLDADDYADLQVGTSGEFGGLGIEVGMEDGLVKVIAPIDDTPAQRAGVQSGDFIVRIDDHSIKGVSLNEAVKLMRGTPGTTVELTLLRSGAEQPIKLRLERAVIRVASVKSRVLEPGYVYIRIANFQAHTTADLRRTVEQLKTDAAGGQIHGLVLDLRNNPGGVLDGAVGVSDLFLTQGLIVYTQGRDPQTKLEFSAGPDDVLNGAPLVVLVNGGSASASEIVAGALQDHHRAIIMGSATFGKGSVQTIVPLDKTTALKLTTARYYTPTGRSIQAHGIVPDIRLERGNLTVANESTVTPLKEADLMRHLSEPPAPSATNKKPATPAAPASSTPDKTTAPDKTAATASLLAEDYQLGQALNVLKALNIARLQTPPAVTAPK